MDSKVAPENKFLSYELAEQELLDGATLSDANVRYIQNQLSAYAHDHLRITYDDANPSQAAIQSSFIKGAIAALDHLLASHTEVQQALLESLSDS